MKKALRNNYIFKALFGIGQEEIKETCVIVPFFSKDIIDGFKVSCISRGILYSAWQNDGLSLIITKMGAGFIGDAVLYLKDTKCKKLVFFGSCGALGSTFKIGDTVLIKKALSQDSFVNMLLKRKTQDVFYPDKQLLDRFSPGFVKANCLSVGSLKLEEEYIKILRNSTIDLVDMETSAFFLASKYIRKKAVSFLYVTDILKTNPYYNTFHKQNIEELKNIAHTASHRVFDALQKLRH